MKTLIILEGPNAPNTSQIPIVYKAIITTVIISNTPMPKLELINHMHQACHIKYILGTSNQGTLSRFHGKSSFSQKISRYTDMLIFPWYKITSNKETVSCCRSSINWRCYVICIIEYLIMSVSFIFIILMMKLDPLNT